MEILWQTMKKCYPNEKAALEAVSKNAAVVQPQARAPILDTRPITPIKSSHSGDWSVGQPMGS